MRAELVFNSQMQYPVNDWEQLWEWLQEEMWEKTPPKCLQTAFPETRTPDAETLALIRLHVNHWLATDEWPPADVELEGWLHLFLMFALMEMMDSPRLGRPMPRTEPQVKGALQGLLLRGWPEVADGWQDVYRRMSQSNQARHN